MIIISIDFLRYDRSQPLDVFRSIGIDYKRHYTHKTFTLPVFQRFGEKLDISNFTLYTDFPNLSAVTQFQEVVITDELFDNIKSNSWVHFWSTLHTIPFTISLAEYKAEFDSRLLRWVSILQNKLQGITEEIIITADHGIVLDPSEERISTQFKGTSEHRRKGGRTPCEVTLHVPLVVLNRGVGIVNRYTSHDGLQEIINGRRTENWLVHPCVFMKRDYTFTRTGDVLA
jgi:hypothetical protein